MSSDGTKSGTVTLIVISITGKGSTKTPMIRGILKKSYIFYIYIKRKFESVKCFDLEVKLFTLDDS